MIAIGLGTTTVIGTIETAAMIVVMIARPTDSKTQQAQPAYASIAGFFFCFSQVRCSESLKLTEELGACNGSRRANNRHLCDPLARGILTPGGCSRTWVVWVGELE